MFHWSSASPGEGYLSVAEGFPLINFKIGQCYPLHFRARRNGGTGCTAETLKPLSQVREGVRLPAAATAACAVRKKCRLGSLAQKYTVRREVLWGSPFTAPRSQLQPLGDRQLQPSRPWRPAGGVSARLGGTQDWPRLCGAELGSRTTSPSAQGTRAGHQPRPRRTPARAEAGLRAEARDRGG